MASLTYAEAIISYFSEKVKKLMIYLNGYKGCGHTTRLFDVDSVLFTSDPLLD